MSQNLARLVLLILWRGFSVIALGKLPLGLRYASYEVTVPRKLTPRQGEGEPRHITYLLQIEGKNQILHLRQKRGVVPKHLPVFTYSTLGHIQTDYPFVRDNCYYRGFIQNSPSSWVALSTCSGGLHGVVQLENKTYEIKPVQTSLTFQHVVFRLEENEDAVRMRCGLIEEEQRHQKAMVRITGDVAAKTSELDWWTHIRYADIVIVVEHERYVKFDRNESTTLLYIFNIVHISNILYEPLGVLLTTIGLEIWSEKNLIEISRNIYDTLKFFNDWRINSLLKRIENDAAHLFAYKYFGRIVGLAYLGTICTNEKSSGVESYMTQSVFHFTNTFVHEFGHNLGMQHDGKYCYCERRACIMAGSHANSDKFSNCSYQDYFSYRNTRCLLIPPQPDKVYLFKLCGNKVVEDEEECDCGSEKNCNSDPCCQANCKLRSGARCAFGDCCVNCQYISAGTVCREKKGICDLPEYCTGASEWCPQDVHIQDGAPCEKGVYCYHGNCTTHTGQCKMIFGHKARTASGACYSNMNMQGDRFGHCVLKHGVYTKCTVQNALCGRIQCADVEELPSLEEHNTIIQMRHGDMECWSTDYHSGMRIPDIGKVRDGTPCGDNMMCIASECTNVTSLNYDCNVTKCHNRGVCNTLKHCHCEEGWAPPNCLLKGNGGSIDSGPPPPRLNDTISEDNPEDNVWFIVVIIIGLLFVLSIAICIGLCFFFRFKVMENWRRLREHFHQKDSKPEENPQVGLM